MLASRWLRLNPPAGRAAQEHPRARSSTRSTGRSSAPTWRCSRFVDAPPLGGGARGARRRWSRCVPLIKAVPKGFLPKNDEAQFEIERAHAGGHQPGRDRARRRADRARGPRVARGARPRCSRIGDNQQKTPNLASIFVRLVPPDKRKATPGRAAGQGARARSCPSSPRSYRISVSEVAAFGAGTFSTATVQYILSGPDLDQLDHVHRRRSSPKLRADPGRGRRRHHAGDRQAGAGRDSRPPQGGRPRASASRTSRSRRSC